MTARKKKKNNLAEGRVPGGSKRCMVVFEPSKVKAEIAPEETLLEAAHKAGVYVNSVCGGAGYCGKCRVVVKKGDFDRRDGVLLSERELTEGTVLACQTRVLSDMTVVVPGERDAEGRILGDLKAGEGGEPASDLLAGRFEYEPLVRKVYLEMTPPSVQDHTADWERLCSAIYEAVGVPVVRAELGVLQNLSAVLRGSGYKATATVGFFGEGLDVIEVERGKTDERQYAVAVDVGTTTVVAHLVDLAQGVTVGGEAAYNSQMRYGEDYIRRIIYAEEHDAFGEMQRRIVGDINVLIERLASKRRVNLEDIAGVVCAGNTAMLHFLMGLDARQIRREPYIPSVALVPPVRAEDVGIKMCRGGLVYCLPCVAAYVGGDVVGGVLATGIYNQEGLSLFVDLGTNGEVVLGNRDWMACASSSAGPAFEGSGVKCGMRAEAGAIEKVRVNAVREIEHRVIGGGRPVGVCGSGLLDVVAEFFRCGIIDRTGCFNIGADRRLSDGEDGPQFELVPAGDGSPPIVVTQADIDNLIRAKAGVFAAIRALMGATHKKTDDLEAVYLAGGFGNFLDVRGAVTIGMLPDVPMDRIRFVGNTSLAGAKMVLLSRRALAESKRLAESMTYFDLMSHPGYMDEFVKANFLPHTDLSLFASVRDVVGGRR